MTIRINFTVIVAALLVGCAGGPEEGGASTKDASPTVTGQSQNGPPSTAALVPRPRPPEAIAHALIDAPEGWSTEVRGGWMIFTSPDGVSRVAEGALNPKDEVGVKVNEIVTLAGASDVHVSDEQPISIGTERFTALAADGWCHLGRDEARVAYAVVATGEERRIILVHLLAKDSPVETRRAALTAIASLRSR